MARKKQTSRLSTGERISVANAERQRSLMSIAAPAQCGSDGSEYQDTNQSIQTPKSTRNDQRIIKRRTVVGGTPRNQQTQNATTHEPSTIIKQLEERRDFARTVANAENYLAEKEEQDELIANYGRQIARLNAELSEQRTEIDSLGEELRIQETKLPVLKSLAKLLCSMEKIYRVSAESGLENDEFLANIEKELGVGGMRIF
ncbi:uncharacterized protein BKA78DRAFT_345006 [Phyllosticta capitalensis]|uniref:uncharacterized protein n=1 Tax=Phyllosticta capitalensis TaxID=121624 RepID=UPI00313035B0